MKNFSLFLSRALGIVPTMTVTQALDRLFSQSSPSAHEIALGFRAWMLSAGLAPGTINRHIAALRSVSKLGRQLGVMTWHLEVGGVKPEKRGVTAGPLIADVKRMLEKTMADTEAETRAHAILMVFVCVGLPVSELCGLNLEETDLTYGTTWILGKGRREREPVPLPAPVVEAIQRYLTHRGMKPGPLFKTRGARGKARDGRLETRSVLRIVRQLGARIGLRLACHALRHTSISAALDAASKAGIGLDKVRAHSRHRTIGTLIVYADEHDRLTTQRTLADLVAGTLTENV